MNAIIHIARLHIQLALQDRGTWIQLFFVPLVLMTLFGVMLGDEIADLDILIDVVNHDPNSQFSKDFITLLQNSASETETLVICIYGAENNPEACGLDDDESFDEDRLKEGQSAAVLIIPENFGIAIENGEPITVEYRSDQQLNTQTLAQTTVQTAISRFGGSLLIAQTGTQIAIDTFDQYESGDENYQHAFTELRQTAQTQMQTPSASLKTTSSGKEIIVGLGFRQSVTGQGSLFVMFALLALAEVLVTERSRGTLQRLFTLPTARVNIVIGKILGAFTFGVLQFTVFILFGVIFFDINWGNDYVALALLVMAYCLAGTTLGFALATVVRTSSQAAGISTLIALTLAPLGGAWWPLDIVPEFMQIAGHVSPIAWVMDGFNELLYYNGTLVDVLPMIGALVGMSMLFTVFAVWHFKYE